MAKLKVKKINKKQLGGGILGNLTNGFSFQDLQQGVGNQYGLGELLSQFQQGNPDFDITGQGSGIAGGMLALLGINEDSKNSAETAFNNRLTTPNYLSQFTAAPNLGMNTGYAQEGGGIPIDNTRVNTPTQQFNPQAAQQFEQQLYNESLNPAIAAYAEKAGKSYDEVKLWLDATAEHESFSGKKLKSTNKNKSVDTGIYHFNSASKPLIGKKTRVFLEDLGIGVPNEVIQLEQGKDVNINSLPKDLQDIMALAHTTKHNNKGEISSYGLSKYDLTSRDGLAKAWVNEHNKGTAKDSLTNAYMNSLDRFGFDEMQPNPEFKNQMGGKINNMKKDKITVNPNGLFDPQNLGAINIVPSRQLSFGDQRGMIDTPTLVIPIPGEDAVAEIPMFKEGGMVSQIQKYKFGGIIGTTFSNNSSIPESDYGYITNGTLIGSFPNGTPIQTEDVNGTAEQIIFQNGAIANVNADTSHSRMTKNGDGDMVTDILPEGSYITSAYGGIKIKKKEVEDFKKIKTYPYAENMKGKAPEEYSFATDYFKKNEKTLTPAELSARVQKKYPVKDKVDIFGSVTNDINRSNRMPDLQVIIGKSEEAKQLKEEARLKRKVKRLVNELEDQGMLIDGDIQFAQNGGSVLKYRKGGKVEMRNVRKAGIGGILQGIGEIGQLVSGIIKNQKLKKSALTQQGMNAANLAKYQDLLGNLTPQLYDRVGTGRDANALGIAGNLGSSLAGILGQNRVSAKPQFFSSFNDINSQIDLGGQNALRGFRNTLGVQNNYNSILNATGDPNQAARVSNAGLAQSSNLANSIYANTSAQKIANLQNRTNELRDYESRITALRNQDIGNFNKGISDVGNAFGSAFSATGQNELSRNQELGKVDLFDFSTNRALDTDFMNRYAGIESFRLGAPNPFAGVNFNTIGNAADSIFGNTNTNANANPGANYGTPTVTVPCGQLCPDGSYPSNDGNGGCFC